MPLKGYSNIVFSDDPDDEDPSNGIEEAIEVKDKKPKDEDDKPKKRIIRNPQPKLDPDRICGSRGIGTLKDVFADFKPKGGDYVYDDLDRAMKKIEHWTHRLYPKLPCDDVLSRISVLGKKMSVQTNVKKIRMGEEPLVKKPIDDEDEEKNDENGQDTTSRYENEFPSEDVFEELMRQADEVMTEKPQPKPSTLTDEQRERMRKNQLLAAERRKAKLEAAKAKEAEVEENPMLVLSDDEEDTINFINKTDEDQPLSQEYGTKIQISDIS